MPVLNVNSVPSNMPNTVSHSTAAGVEVASANQIPSIHFEAALMNARMPKE